MFIVSFSIDNKYYIYIGEDKMTGKRYITYILLLV